ncbi:uncharacterized protein WCC33_014731 [Rhinophrynus dorsalis]
MSTTQKDPDIHMVTIQQTYWMKDTSEEKILQMGEICLSKVVEQVDYYDTDAYDLALNKTWLSKTGREWRLIVDRSGHDVALDTKSLNTRQIQPPKGNAETRKEDAQSMRQTDSKRGKTKNKLVNESTRQDHEQPSKMDYKKNTDVIAQSDTNGNTLTFYELTDEKDIIAHLSRILHSGEKTHHKEMSDFLQLSGVQHYSSFQNVKKTTYKLRDIYTVIVMTDEATSRKVAVIYLDVEIEKVTQGFQKLEHLANELDLQLQTA